MAQSKIRASRIGRRFLRSAKAKRMVEENHDVTKLARKSALLEIASMAGVVGVWDWDITNDVLTWDPVIVRLCGLRPKELQGTLKTWEQAIHPDDKAFVMQEVQAALQGWRDYRPRFRMIWPDGSVHYIQAHSRTTYRGDGMPVRMIGVNFDITEQVERELEVEQQRAQLAATMDALLDPLMFLSLETSALQPPALRIAEANPAACRFFGRNHAQLLGQPLSVLLPEHTNDELSCALKTACRTGIPWIADEQPIQLRGMGEAIYADVRAVASRDGVVLSFRDVSERRRAAGRLSQSEERFRLLAENASDAVFIITEGIMRWMSPAITTMLGWQPQEWNGHQFLEFCHPADIALALKSHDDINAGAVRITRLRLRDQAGHWRWVEVHSGPYRNPQGEQIGILGPEYIPMALEWAHQSDPGARLLINEYGLEAQTPAAATKRIALLALLRDLRRRHGPLHGLGLQAHLQAGLDHGGYGELAEFLKLVQALGLEIQITELDVDDRLLPLDPALRDQLVAAEYDKFLAAVLSNPAVRQVTTWGLSDRYTWLNNQAPPPDGWGQRALPFDEALRANPVVALMGERFAQAASAAVARRDRSAAK